MDEKEQFEKKNSTGAVAFDEQIPCDRCGRLGAYDFSSRHLCLDCYENCTSCCPEFGQDDLWEFPED